MSRCESCYWWDRQNKREHRRQPSPDTVEIVAVVAPCRRHAPTYVKPTSESAASFALEFDAPVVLPLTTGRFPTTEARDWCGEFT